MTQTTQDTDELIILSENVPTVDSNIEAKSILEPSNSEETLSLGDSLIEGVELNSDSSSKDLGTKTDISNDSGINILGETENSSDILFTSTGESESLVIDDNEKTSNSESLISTDNNSDILFPSENSEESSLLASEDTSDETDTISFSLETNSENEKKTEETKSETLDFGGISISGNIAFSNNEAAIEAKEFNMNTILDDTITKMEERKGQNDKEIENKNSEISLLKSRIEELKKQVSEREKEIKKLETENTNIEVNISQLNLMKSSESSVSTRTRAHNSKKVAIK